jgi:hypothetical protein
VLATTYYCGLLLIADVSGDDAYNTTLFYGFIAAVNGLLLFVIMPITFVIQLRMLSKAASKFVQTLSPTSKGKSPPGAVKRGGKGGKRMLTSTGTLAKDGNSGGGDKTPPMTTRGLLTVYEFPSPPQSPTGVGGGGFSAAVPGGEMSPSVDPSPVRRRSIQRSAHKAVPEAAPGAAATAANGGGGEVSESDGL